MSQVQLSVEGILADLDNGLTRDEIQSKYGLSNKDMKQVFSHPDLKGKKAKTKPGFVWGENHGQPASEEQETGEAKATPESELTQEAEESVVESEDEQEAPSFEKSDSLMG